MEVGMFKEDNGNTSSIRVLTFIVVVCILFNWTYVTLLNGQYIPLSFGDVGALVGTFVAKGWQKGKEKS